MDSTFGNVLASWRSSRGLSQLSLALETDVSQRHISFLETGRAKPSRDMVMRLSETLRVPLQHRNAILVSAGFAPVFREEDFDSPRLKPVMNAIEALLYGVEPAPAFVVDAAWDLRKMNAAAMRFLVHLVGLESAGDALAGHSKPNVMRMLFDPQLLKPHILDWDVTASGLLQRMHRDASVLSGDNPVRDLIEQLLALPGVPAEWREIVWQRELPPAMTISFRVGPEVFTFFATITTIGTPYDITLDDLRLETFFPANEETKNALKRLE